MSDEVFELFTFSAGMGGAVLFAHGIGLVVDTALNARLSFETRWSRSVWAVACIVVGAIVLLTAMRFKP